MICFPRGEGITDMYGRRALRMFGMDKNRSVGLIIGAAALVLLAARGARGLLYCVSRASGLFILIAVAALAYGFIRKDG